MAPRLQVVGAVTLFFLPAPLLMKQAYLIVTGKQVNDMHTVPLLLCASALRLCALWHRPSPFLVSPPA